LAQATSVDAQPLCTDPAPFLGTMAIERDALDEIMQDCFTPSADDKYKLEELPTITLTSPKGGVCNGPIYAAGTDSPRSSASTQLSHSPCTDRRERTRSPESHSCSIDSWSGMSEGSDPGPTAYRPNDHMQSRHKRFPAATIGKGPGHDLVTTSSTSPGPSDCSANDRVLASRRSASSVTFGHGPGHQSDTHAFASPGPTSYNPSDKLYGHHLRFPAATFGQAAGHDLFCRTSPSPGPTEFCGDDRVEARRRRSSSATIGRGPGHEVVNDSRQKSPGPTSYSADDKLLAGHRKFPTATFGTGPAHFSSSVSDSSPGPASYNRTHDRFDSRNVHTAQASLELTGRENASAEERRSFKKADLNTDGKLDFGEVESLVRSRFPRMNNEAVHALFKASDTNHDGVLDFQELIAYIRSTDPAGRKLREKMQMAFAPQGLPQSYREGEERIRFRRSDKSLNGVLELQEIECLMRQRFPDIKKRHVHEIFKAIDRNHDGKLDFQEVSSYAHSRFVTDDSSRKMREMLLAALSETPTQRSERLASVPGKHHRPAVESAPKDSSKQSSPKLRRASSASAVGSLIASPKVSA